MSHLTMFTQAIFLYLFFLNLELCFGYINLADIECGQQSIRINPKLRDARIAGGREAFHGEFPWMVSFQYNLGEAHHFCGGFLINRTTVLAAAHCFRDISRDRVNVIIGEQVVGQTESPIDSKLLRIASINVHPEYTPSQVTRHDIALVHLDSAVEWNLYVQPACLSNTEDDTQTGKFTQVAGWGQTEESSYTTSKTLKTVGLNIVSHSVCENEYDWTPSQKQFCAGHSSKEQGACKGDSGSPLMIKDSNQDFTLSVVGIHTGGRGCGINMLPGVYTKISSYIQWIRTNEA